MKRSICLLLAVLLLAALLAGCAEPPKPTDTNAEATGDSAKNTETAAQTETAADTGTEPAETEPVETEPIETEPARTEPAGSGEDPEEEFAMEEFLDQLVKSHPGAGAEELCRAMLESPYFALFQLESTEFYFPGLDFEYRPERVDEACCVADYVSGSGAVVYFFVPEQDADPVALANELAENAMPNWVNYDNPLDRVAAGVLGDNNRVFLAMYRSDMKPVEGPVAGKARDFVEMFHAYLAENPEADCLELAQYFAAHQRMTGMDTYQVAEGQLVGFGDMERVAEIKGFSDGAIFTPQMSPSTFIGYVFRTEDPEAFMAMLRENANLNWNICVTADTVITEADGNAVLFIMCMEN